MNTPVKCPSCREKLRVIELCCAACSTTIKGGFDFPPFAALTTEDEVFLRVFLTARGSIKEVGRQLKISYPTVKGRLDALLGRLGLDGLQLEAKKRHLELLERLERGEITAREAIDLLNNLES